jgi:GT2 family glycosyltransferase
MEVVMVDDASEDGSEELIRRAFPTVRVVRLERNVGFGRAVGAGMAALETDWVYLLNNDLILQPDFCQRLIQTLEARAEAPPFAIGAQTRDWESQAPNHGGQRARFAGGMILQEPFECEEAAPTVFFQAGACLIDRRRFLELGGFAGFYEPGYWEDYDLAWQAASRGWLNLYDPRAVAFHLGKGSMRRRFGAWGVSLLIRRNHLLFVWVNLRDFGLLTRHLAALPGLVWADPAQPEQAGWGRALLAALGRLGPVLRARRQRRATITVSERKILIEF